MNNIISDEYYNYGDLIDIKRKKEPYIFTITSTNSIGNSVVSEPTTDVIPFIVPIISSFNIVPSSSTALENQSNVSIDATITIDNGGSNITSIDTLIVHTICIQIYKIIAIY